MNCPQCGHPLHKLDDWVDGVPDAWDYEAVLRDNKVELAFDPMGNGWTLAWEKGFMNIGIVDHDLARKAAALFVELWLRGVSASFADKLMEAYLIREELP